jgi:hypothetical protein
MENRIVGMFLVTLLVMASGAGAVANESVRVMAGTSTTTAGRLMVEELRTYFGKLFTNPVEFRQEAESCQVVLGTPESNARIRDLIRAGQLTLPQGKNADQGYAIKTVGQTLHVAASTEIGLLYGVYALLEAYGAYFQISGDCLPAKQPFLLKQLNICTAPIFKYRGLLPWDNFMCGASGFNPEDWRTFLRNATRMRYNKLDLHFYPGCAWYTEAPDGKPTDPSWIMEGATFVSAGKPGAAAFTGQTTSFVVRAWADNRGNPLKQAEACQSDLREAIDVARGWGWVVVAGISLMEPRNAPHTVWAKLPNGDHWANPLEEGSVADALARYRRLVELYPTCDFYWLWQSEAGGPRWRDCSLFPALEALRKERAGWGEEKNSGDRDYAEMFLRVVNRLTPQERARIATGGWDIQHLFPGIQKVMPPEIIFASLNSFRPARSLPQMENYRIAKEGRRAWTIAWWEFDGNQWFPQFRLGMHEAKYRRAAEYGVEGMSLLGWKWSGTEHHQRYLAEFAWEPNLTAETFIKRFVGRVYGPAVVEEMAALYARYEDWEAQTPPAGPADDRDMVLGAGWCNLPVPEIPSALEGFAAPKWKHTVTRAKAIIVRQEKLKADDLASVAVLQELLPRMTESGRSWARLLANRLTFRARYIDATLAMNRSFIAYDEAAARSGDIAVAMKVARIESAKAVKLAAEAIDIYADDCRNRGDLGVVAQLNYLCYDVLRRLDTTFEVNSLYQTIDDSGFRLAARIRVDGARPWGKRDGMATSVATGTGNEAVQRVGLGGNQAGLGSVWIQRTPVDLTAAPILDMRLRTTSTHPLRLMFQVPGREDWYAIDLVGTQKKIGKALDGVKAVWKVNDGNWHRVNWNLRQMVAERIGPGVTAINNLIVGSWVPAAEPAVIEFKRVAFGIDNRLDGQEQ